MGSCNPGVRIGRETNDFEVDGHFDGGGSFYEGGESGRDLTLEAGEIP